MGLFDVNEGWTVTVPEALIPRIINECHSEGPLGHVGIRKTVLRIRQRYFFKAIRRRVTTLLWKCVICKRAKSNLFTLGTPLSPVVSFRPFRAIAVDLYTPGTVDPDGYRYVLTVVCLCTRWVKFFPL